MILNALAERLKRRAKSDFKGRHFEALLYGNHEFRTAEARRSPVGPEPGGVTQISEILFPRGRAEPRRRAAADSSP